MTQVRLTVRDTALLLVLQYTWWPGLHCNILQAIRITGLMEDKKHVSFPNTYFLFLNNIDWCRLAEFRLLLIYFSLLKRHH